jgi:L-ascorbate metabolism protein UlaG (beta-lactamase superfamily)
MERSIELKGVMVEWLGHAGFMFKSHGKVVYVDPFKVHQGDKADLIMVTHEHYDHCDPGSVKALSRSDTVVVAPAPCGKKLGGAINIKPGQTLTEKGVTIRAVPAYNRSKSFHPMGSGVGFVFSIEGLTVYHAGDTDSIPEMSGLGSIDLALLPVGGTYTMNHSEAAQAAGVIGAGLTIPMHWGDIVGTRDDAERFRKEAKVPVKVLG